VSSEGTATGPAGRDRAPDLLEASPDLLEASPDLLEASPDLPGASPDLLEAAPDPIEHGEAHSRLLLAHMPGTLVAMFDRELRCQLLEGPIVADSGIDPNAWAGVQFDVASPCAAFDGVRPLLQRALVGVPGVLEYTSAATGRVYEVEAFARRSAAGEIDGVCAICRDVSERRARDADLRRLATVIEHSEDAIIAAELDGRIVLWNDGAQRLYGFTSDEILGQPFTTVIKPERRAGFPDLVRRIVDGESIPAFDTRRDRPDGTVIDISVTLSPIRDPDSTVIGFSAICRDVTERRRAEREVKRALEVINESQRLAGVGSWAWDPATDETAWSAEMYRIFERDPEHGPVRDRALFALIHPDDRDEVRRRYRAGFDGRVTFDLEYRLALPSGTEKVVRVTGRADSEHPGAYVGMTQDVTELRDRERRMQESREELRERTDVLTEVFDHAPIGMALVAPDGLIRQVNQAYCDLLGYTASELMTHTFLDVTHPEDVAIDLENRQAISDGLPLLTREKRYIHRDGSVVWVALSISAVRDAGGRPRYFIAQVQDITRAREAAAALREANAELSAIFENVPAGFTLRDLDGRFRRVNARAARVLGAPVGELLGRAATDVEVSRRLSERHLPDRQILEERRSSTVEVAVTLKDGATVDLMSVRFPVIAETGEATGLASFTIDITARKRSERAAREAEARFRALIEAAPDGIVIADEAGTIVLANRRTEEMFGYPSDELIGAPVETLMPIEFIAAHRGGWAAYVADPSTRLDRQGLELIGRRRDGRTFPLEVGLSPVQTAEGLLIASSMRDITARRETERQVARLAAIVESSREAIVGITLEGTIASWNPAAEQMYGYTADEAVGQPNSLLFTREEPPERSRANIARIANGEVVETFEAQRRTKDGRTLDVEIIASPIKDARGTVVGVSAIARDIGEERRASLALAAAHERFRAAFENAPIGMALTGLTPDSAGRLLQVNPALSDMLGAGPHELDGESLATLSHPDDMGFWIETQRRVANGDAARHEQRFVARDGRVIWAIVNSTPIPEPGGAAAMAVTQIVDISDRKAVEEQFRHLADHDPLTALYNRHRFESELQRIVEETARHGRPSALLLLDMDAFKYVNDRFGHRAGDQLVRRVASLMRGAVRESDCIARIGGDEFAIILQECPEADAVRVAQKLLETIRTSAILVDDTNRARVTTSIGLTTFDGTCSLSASELVVEADIAMYDAKASGKDRYALYDRTSNRRATMSRRHVWLDRLRDALDRDAFELFAQAIVPMAKPGAPRFELLLRMRDEDGRVIEPGAFLDSAERFDLMGEIDRWVLCRTIRLLHEHAAAGHELSLAANISGRTMNDELLVTDLARMLAESPIPVGSLIVEVTETAAIVNMERARDLARDLRRLGCRFALDDFPAGFASFYYLKHLDFDYLKIDGEFIKQITRSPTDQLVVRAVVDIARGLGTETVAECVGDEPTVELLRGLGVTYAQGHHLGTPGPLPDRLPSTV
jgi:diguanylate cyclase (GGDEF)-like protein/PAS domain S-box-containing protein